MEQKDFDIYEILKGVPVGTKLYTPMCGNVGFAYLATNKEAGEAIWTTDKNGEYTYNKNGRWMEGGEVMLFPSDRMRDWSKFAWKKGDVLITEDGNAHIIFEKFTDDTYTIFAGKYYYCKNGKKGYTYLRECDNAITEEFTLETEDAAKTYIGFIEKRLGGKLNRETLEIEKPAFEIGKLYVFNEQDEDGELTIIGKLIGKDESYDTLTFGYQYEIENEKFVTDQTFDLRISVHEELREATEGEAITFQEACTLWEKSKEQGKEQPPFKPFDKVLVRIGGRCKWIPAFFVRDRGEDFAWRYNVLPLHGGKQADFAACISYEGNEHLAFTDCDTENLSF
ncbi:hypothetical protein DXD25_03980 [Prevotella sp. TF12-30]|uniref:hypothetical protein n=1 Tax=Prevotellaceae TaxID=171552 RepID=UPI000E44AB8E|nr:MULTISPECIES: hypothetical protein [Prevotellaceae]RGK33604.1 hypothetical protein DXD25_03980 [Prevotella sp. TF12-30]